MINKKAVSLSMNTIIIAALAIIVLLVLVYLLLNSINNASNATSCNSKGGVCMDSCSGVYAKSLGTDLCEDGQECCVPDI